MTHRIRACALRLQTSYVSQTGLNYSSWCQRIVWRVFVLVFVHIWHAFVCTICMFVCCCANAYELYIHIQTLPSSNTALITNSQCLRWWMIDRNGAKKKKKKKAGFNSGFKERCLQRAWASVNATTNTLVSIFTHTHTLSNKNSNKKRILPNEGARRASL